MKLRQMAWSCALLVLLACGCKKELPKQFADVAAAVKETRGDVDVINFDGTYIEVLYAGRLLGKEQIFDAYDRALVAAGWTKKPSAPELRLPPTQADYVKEARKFSLTVSDRHGDVAAYLDLH